MAQYNFTDGQSKPGFTADGIKWYQQCFVCNKQINFIKDYRESWMSVGQYVRHKKCAPTTLK
jgi:hypothetical protein